MNFIELGQKIEEKYRDYLRTTFYFRDRDLRASFEAALRSGQLRQGPFLSPLRFLGASRHRVRCFPLC